MYSPYEQQLACCEMQQSLGMPCSLIDHQSGYWVGSVGGAPNDDQLADS